MKMEEEVQGEEPEGRVRVESSEGKGAGQRAQREGVQGRELRGKLCGVERLKGRGAEWRGSA